MKWYCTHKEVLDVNVKMEDKEIQKHFEKLPAILPTNQGTLSFFQTTDSISSKKNEEVGSPVQDMRHITATISQPMNVARRYCENLSIEPTSKTTSVVTVSLKTPVCSAGRILSTSCSRCTIVIPTMTKNEIAQKTAEFIDERIGIISKTGKYGSGSGDFLNVMRESQI